MQGPTKKKLNWCGLINYYIANLIILLKKNIMVVKKNSHSPAKNFLL